MTDAAPATAFLASASSSVLVNHGKSGQSAPFPAPAAEDPPLKPKDKMRFALSAIAFRLTARVYSVCDRAAFAPQSAAICENAETYARLRRGSGGYTGTGTSPARKQARKATMKSRDGRYTSSMRSPEDRADLQDNEAGAKCGWCAHPTESEMRLAASTSTYPALCNNAFASNEL